MEALMASKVKVTVSLEEALVRALSAAGRKARKPRRPLVEQAMKEGYLAMAQEDRATAKSHLPAGWEAVK
jgi:hypothetical protein